MGIGVKITGIDHFNIRLVTTLNYSAIVDLRTLQITTAHDKSSQSAVFTSRSLVTASKHGDSLASALTSSPAVSQAHQAFFSQTPLQLTNF
jgi:hypothetical protein